MKIPLLLLGLSLASPAAAHDWYAGLVSPKTKQGCCNQADCEPVEHCILPGGALGVTIRGQCFVIDPAVVLEMPSPDGQVHACMAPADTAPRCIILGGGA